MSIEGLLWAALQAFLQQLGLDLTLKGKPGKIVNISSVSGSYTLPFSVSLTATPRQLALTPHMLWDAVKGPSY